MNAKNELLKTLRDINKKLSDVLCAHIVYGDDFYEDSQKTYTLKVNHSSNDVHEFINNLDFIYDPGYGGQELFGEILFTDNSWLERSEYDGSEWWSYKKFEIPQECL